jgi:hypothetical protein
MTTGSFRHCANLKGAVSISNGVPDFFHGPQYKRVAPRWEMLKMPQAEYDREFNYILLRLDPKQVYNELVKLGGEDAILLCWEKPNAPCHRRRVAEWLEENLGIVITEYGMERSEVYPYFGPRPEPAPPPAKKTDQKQLELF